ncbi:MAG: repeat domain in Vibrio, Colwellia, Bradyrhizobium and Shewanella, partial [Armatimonadetes bacterium]|nr:repeat domain in Vibrio, Colwellia, Bradyrhizobium and Shewanella [Armatimonadota bacterium]
MRLADANGDGLPDIVTGWEQGGVVRVYLHPGPAKSQELWPAVTAGQAPGVEDAVLVDLDRDGAVDVVSCAEQGSERMAVHWAPKEPSRYLDEAAWKTEPLPASEGRLWMFCEPAQVDGKHGVDLIAGGKGKGAAIGWWEAPADPRDLKAWRWHPLRPVGWIMSLVSEDMDGDGDADLLFSDRKGAAAGCFWLEHPGTERAAEAWAEHPIGVQGQEVMFLRTTDLDRDRLRDVVAAVKPRELHY